MANNTLKSGLKLILDYTLKAEKNRKYKKQKDERRGQVEENITKMEDESRKKKRRHDAVIARCSECKVIHMVRERYIGHKHKKDSGIWEKLEDLTEWSYRKYYRMMECSVCGFRFPMSISYEGTKHEKDQGIWVSLGEAKEKDERRKMKEEIDNQKEPVKKEESKKMKDENVYSGEKDKFRVLVNGEPLPIREDILNISPVFDWGNVGPGSAQLSLAILAFEFNPDIALKYYQEFQWDIVSRLEKTFRLTSESIKSWMGEKEKTKAER